MLLFTLLQPLSDFGKDIMHTPTTSPRLRKTRWIIQFPNIKSSIFINFHLYALIIIQINLPSCAVIYQHLPSTTFINSHIPSSTFSRVHFTFTLIHVHWP